ncbi:hypothetical protein J6X13_01315 [Candidatus Saccharibacteria bacterium]|nr:hypothetical protein [Candidatus Saccharibacteria bacterium]
MAKILITPKDSENYSKHIADLAKIIIDNAEKGAYHYDVCHEVGGDIGFIIPLCNLGYTFPEKYEEWSPINGDLRRAIESYLYEIKGEKIEASAWVYEDVMIVDY